MLPEKVPRAICAEVVRLLAGERKRLGISKYELEQRSGVSQQMIGYMERGLRNPSLETAVRIAEGLEIDLGKLLRMARAKIVKTSKNL